MRVRNAPPRRRQGCSGPPMGGCGTRDKEWIAMQLEPASELEAFRKRVRAFIAEHAPGIKTHAGVRAPEPELMPAIRAWTAKLYEAGFLGIDWPAEYGGRPDAHP